MIKGVGIIGIIVVVNCQILFDLSGNCESGKTTLYEQIRLFKRKILARNKT